MNLKGYKVKRIVKGTKKKERRQKETCASFR